MKQILFTGSVLFFFWACSSQVAFTTKKTDEVDSVLFYQQQNVSDAFIDSILVLPDSLVQLDTTLVPPPAQDTLQTVDGFRVQVFAGLDQLRARSLAAELKNLLQDSIYTVRENGLFKVQAGDFLHRPKADSVQRKLTISSYAGTWVVARQVFVYPDASDSTTAARDSEPAPYKYKIQIMATGDEIRAMQMLTTLRTKLPDYPAYYLQSGQMYKVYVGKFVEKDAADSALKQVRQAGYPDAWLVY